MTDIELEKKAEEYAEKQQGVFRFLSDHIKFGFIAGAKEMQKEKEELKEENEHIRRLLGIAIIVLNRIENPEVPYEKVVDSLRKLKELLGSVE
jgi:hypothetical protein